MSQQDSSKSENEKEQDQDDHEPTPKGGWKMLFVFTTKKHLPFLGGALVFGAIAGICFPTQAIFYGLIFNQFAKFGSGDIPGAVMLHHVSKFCIWITAIASIHWFANSLFLMFWLTFGELQARSARDRIFSSLLIKDSAWYDSKTSGVGAFLSSLQLQVRDLQLGTSQPMGQAWQATVVALASIGIALYFSWDLTLVTICSVPIVYILMGWLSSRLSKNAHLQGDSLQEALKYLTAAIQNIETVKCFNGQRGEAVKYTKAIDSAARHYNGQANLRSIQLGTMQFVTLMMFVQGFWYGSHLVSTGRKTPAQVVTAIWAAQLGLQNITSFLPQLIVIQKGQVAAARLQTMIANINGYETAPDAQGGQLPNRCVGDVHLTHVSFSYPLLKEKLALQDATMFFPAGETTFVIGRSGSGKSTIGQLLVRLYERSSGQICLDGIDLKELDVHWLRRNVTLVEQHSVLFNDTIRGNIAMGKWRDETISLDGIRYAAEFAYLTNMVNRLPKGLDTVVGTDGGSLSGGQKQRVALARARLRDTPVLILDESTSALDYVTKAHVMDALRTWRRGKTTIIITHDISQIQSDDYVYILDNSRVVQEGIRSSLEEDVNSPFSTFLATSSEEKEEQARPEDDDITSEFSDLYGGSWDTASNRDSRFSSLNPNPNARRSLFLESNPRQSVLPQMVSPFSGLATHMEEISLSRRPSIAGSERGARPSSFIMNKGEDIRPSTSPSNIGVRSRPPSAHGNLSNQDLSPIGAFHSQREVPKEQVVTTKEENVVVPKALSTFQIMRRVWRKLDWVSRIYLNLAFICAGERAAATPAFSFLLARLMSTYYIAVDREQKAMIYALAIVGIAVVDGIATYLFHFLFDYCSQTWVNLMKREAYERILDQPRVFFDLEENSISRISETLDHFAEEARNVCGRFVGIIFVVFSMSLIAVAWSLASCWKLTLVIMAVSPIIYAITAGYKAVSSRWERKSSDADESIGSVLWECFTNIRTVRCLELEGVFDRKYTKATTSALKIGIRRSIYVGPFYGLNFSAIYYLAAFLFWYGARLMGTGQFTPTSVLQSAILLILCASYANFIVNLIPQIGSAKDGATRLVRLSDLPADSHEHAGTVRLVVAKVVNIENLDFAYSSRPDQKVLQGVSFNIPPGSCTAIVGTSGSGKSTIASLLFKLYPIPEVGDHTLTVYGRDIRKLHTNSLRSRMAIVSQTPVLFPGTIEENIAYGLPLSSPETSLDNIRRAASAAGIDEFVDGLSLGYQTVVGEGGTRLSGGQAQRIAIARALARKPDILVLDEATSALDVESASTIRDTVQRLVLERRAGSEEDEGMTVIIITHARNMMAIAERIVMLDQGRVVEEGTFTELKRRRGPFARLLRGEDGVGPAPQRSLR